LTGENPTRSGNVNQVAQPAALFEASDGPFVMAVANDRQFRQLCTQIIGRPELAQDARFRTNPARVANGGELRSMLAGIFRRGSRDDWVNRLRQVGVAAGVVATVAEALTSGYVAARGLVRQLDHCTVGSYPALRGVARLHGSAALPAVGAPVLGEHTREVLAGVAGLSPQAITALIDAGIAKAGG
jgi:crotonobetainyl-CoA:carnitine CoA-transferase CaiB-like acyl-CoA transferase